jgi:Holliday junction DNA helicase RuvA
VIAFVRGRLVRTGPDWVEVDAQGLGFRVGVTSRAAAALPPPGGEVCLPTLLLWREDGPSLLGFVDEAEREACRALLGVAGIGARTAVALLSALTPEALAQAVAAEDAAVLTRVPGVGPKTARRLVVELKGRLVPRAVAEAEAPVAEAQQALEALGYSAEEAARALAQVRTVGGEAADLVRAALRVLARG